MAEYRVNWRPAFFMHPGELIRQILEKHAGRLVGRAPELHVQMQTARHLFEARARL